MPADISRRVVLGRAGLVATGLSLVLSGCLVEGENETDPRIVRTETEPDVLAAAGNPVEVRVLIHNVGSAGEVEVVVQTTDRNGETVDTVSTTIEMEGQSQREITVEITPSSNAADVAVDVIAL